MGDVRMSDEARAAIGQALDDVRGDFSRAQARDAAWNAVMPLLERSVAGQVVQTAVVRPGDTLILRVAERAPMEYIDRCRKTIREELSGVEVLFVGGVEEMAIYRPEARCEYAVGGDVTPEQAARFAKELERQRSMSSVRDRR